MDQTEKVTEEAHLFTRRLQKIFKVYGPLFNVSTRVALTYRRQAVLFSKLSFSGYKT